MATVLPFRGLLFSASRIPDLQPVVAPPYDVIPPEKAGQLRARDPHNIIHLDLPAGEPPARYSHASTNLKTWLQEGILERDTEPSIYVTSQRYAVRGMPERIRWGFIALLRIEDEGSAVVLPHERTMDAPLMDRLELSVATRAQLSPIFVVFSDPEGRLSSMVEGACHRPADRWATDDAGVETRLWRLADHEAARGLCDELESHRIWIADGHHRYAAARGARDRLRREDPGSPAGSRSYDYVMAYFSNVDSPGLTILPYHRVTKGVSGFDPKGLARRAEAHFDVKHFPFDGLNHRAEQMRRRLRETSDRGRLAIGLYTGGAEFILLVLKTGMEDGALMADLPAALRKLDVSVLHRGVFETAMEITPEALRAGGQLRYTEEAEKAIDWVDASEGQAAFLLGQPSKQQIMAVAEAGLQMPQKSTYFYPKVLTGLVLHSLEPFDEIGRLMLEQVPGDSAPR